MTRSRPEGYGSGDRDATPPVPDQEHEEHELRVLLERATPHLGAPAGRMVQVRRRVARRRQRRAALGAAVTGVAAVAVLVTFLRPFTPGESSARPAPLGSSLRAVPSDGPTTPPPTDDPTSSPGTALAGFPDLGLKLTLSPGWRTGSVRPKTASAADFVTNQPVVAWDTCPDLITGVFACAPVSPLGKDGVVIAFQKTNKPHVPSGKKTFNLDKPVRASKSCQLFGGDLEFAAWGIARTTDDNRPVAVDAFVCLKNVSPSTVLVVEKILTRAVVSTPASTRAPDGQAG
ncbi:hypothetical protein [Streptomyces sp. SID3212]|uniref:hypothetical protein n=1 Tax=Streptomyces sp. SID3212 TaxID=2690259 RepID=UPI00136C2B21|nr:hypothetical protein [Streptomyces sp. SID3212]MYV55643.1 hypothetical protein [Streptomyces sp. SID3212]